MLRKITIAAMAGVMLVGSVALASETITYTYDARGRVVNVAHSGSVNNTVQTGYEYDAANNRTRLHDNLSSTSSSSSSSSTSSSSGGESNTPPTTANDSVSVAHCSVGYKNVTANDTDADGDYPLTLVSLSGSGAAFSSIISASTIEVDAPGSAGSYSLTYTIQDSRGATANGTLSITVTGSGACE